MANPFVHLELYTGDLAKAKTFYGKLFDWKLQDIPLPAQGESGTYTMIDVGGGTGGGMLQNPRPVGPHWLAYVGVDDLSASLRKARELGAKVVMDKTEAGGFGWMAILTDPTGAEFALWQPKPKQGQQQQQTAKK
jgi:predicted enzyme related to lactoylglutathione lyase